MTRWTARLSLAAVAVIAAIASYLHALVVVQAADGHGVVAWFIPLLADLVIASAAANILDAGRTGFPRPRWSVVAIAVGIVVTVGSNIMSGYPHAVPSWLVNAWPPVAFLLGLESITGHVRRSRQEAKDAAELGVDAGDLPPLPVAISRLADLYSERQLAAAFGVPRSRVKTAARLPEPPLAAPALNGSGRDGS